MFILNTFGSNTINVLYLPYKSIDQLFLHMAIGFIQTNYGKSKTLNYSQ